MESKQLELDYYNDTDTNQNLVFSVAREDYILDNDVNDYLVGVSRFFIPSDAVTPFKQSSTTLTDYSVGLYMRNLGGTPAVTLDKYVVLPLYDTLTHKSNSQTDLLDNCNSRLIESFYSMFESVQGSEVCKKVVKNDELIFTSSSLVKTITISDSIQLMYTE